MLTEFAFTPSVFSADSHADADLWQERLHALGTDMFPRTAPCPVVVSDLHDGSWYAEALSWVKNVENRNHKAKLIVQSLLQKLQDRLVIRPACSGWPSDDIAWAREAIISNSVEPIDRIIACEHIRESLAHENREVRSLNEVDDGGFWHGISSQKGVPMRIDDQILALRKVTLYSEFIWLVTPYISGGVGNDTDFAAAFVKATFLRPEGFTLPKDVVIHTQMPEDEAVIQNVASTFRSRISRILKRTQTVRLVMWQKRFLERYTIGGLCRESSKGKQKLSVRWGVFMGHIARNVKEDETTQLTTQWSLLPSKGLDDVFRQFDVDDTKARTRTFVIGPGT